MPRRPAKASDCLVFLYVVFLLLIVLLWIESHRRFYRDKRLGKGAPPDGRRVGSGYTDRSDRSTPRLLRSRDAPDVIDTVARKHPVQRRTRDSKQISRAAAIAASLAQQANQGLLNDLV